MRNLLILLFFTLPFFTFSQINFRIEGKILNVDSLSEIRPFSFGNITFKKNVVEIIDGSFVVEGVLEKPNMIIFDSDKLRGGLPLWISESGTLKASFYVAPNGNRSGGLIHPFNVEGNQEAIDLVHFHKNQNELTGILKNRPERKAVVADYIYNFLEARINSTFTSEMIRLNISSIGLERANFLHSLLNSDVKLSEEGISLKEELERDEANRIGNLVSDFTLPDINNAPLNLFSISKDYTIIDFWASWCAPCRSANKEMVKLYPKLIVKGVNVIGVSLDEDGENWLSAIKKDSLPWAQVSDLKGYDSDVIKAYKVRAIPYKILIDKDKKIVAVGLQNIKDYLKI